MSKKVEIELNLPGLNELMKGSEIQSVLKSAGNSVAQAAGSDYACDVDVINWIAIANVYPNSRKAAHENFKDNSLLKAVGSVGLPMSKK